MYRRLNIFLIIGAVFTIITGTLLHFVYEWSGESLFVGIFSPINESVWEHLKLLFFPMSVWILIGYFIFKRTTLIISKKPGNTGISRDIRTEFTTDLLLSD